MSQPPAHVDPYDAVFGSGQEVAATAPGVPPPRSADPYAPDQTAYRDERYYPPPMEQVDITSRRIDGAPAPGTHLGPHSEISQGHAWRSAAPRNRDGFRGYPAPVPNPWEVPLPPEHAA